MKSRYWKYRITRDLRGGHHLTERTGGMGHWCSFCLNRIQVPKSLSPRIGGYRSISASVAKSLIKKWRGS